MAKKKKDTMVGDMVNMGVGNIVGTGLIGASADVAAGLPSGMAKTITGTAVGMQGVALLGHNIGYVNKSLGIKKTRPKKKSKKFL